MDTPKTPKTKKPIPTRVDANGQSIPVSIIRPEILKQDSIVTKTINRAIKLHDRIVADKNQFFEDVELYLQQVAEKNGLDWKGNAVLNSFDGNIELKSDSRNASSSASNPTCQAEDDECIKAWSADSNVNLRAIISEAFQVDKKGEIAKYVSCVCAATTSKIKLEGSMELIDQPTVVATKQHQLL